MNTEQEAIALWCPMVRASIDTDDCNASNAGTDDVDRVLPYSLCIASQCAMWRWNAVPAIGIFGCINRPDAMTEEEAGVRPKHVPASWHFSPDTDGDGAAWIEPEDKQYARRTGYCGLAGKPGVA